MWRKIREFFPRLEDIAEVMDPLSAGEALAPIGNGYEISKIASKVEMSNPIDIHDQEIVDEHLTIISPVQDFEIEEVEEVVEESRREVTLTIDFVNNVFADVMRVMCNIGLAMIIIFSLFYFAGVHPSDDLNLEVQKWSEPASSFWGDVKGLHVEGYGWFLSNLLDPENDVVLSIVLLALTPIVGIILTIPRTSGVLRLLFIVITAEFLYAIFRVYLMGSAPAH